MLTAEQNRLLTEIGPNTRMGGLMRRYWHPVAAIEEMEDRWTKKVRVLGEDLVLFKDRTGKLGLVQEACPHRRASLANGIPTECGIRCPYHGWEFDHEGTCTDQPFESERHAFHNKKTIAAYPVKPLAGMLWSYMGPLPAPELPEYDPFTMPGAIRAVGKWLIPCNWLQCMENSADPVHTEWLHGALTEFVHEKDDKRKSAMRRKHEKIDFSETPYGLVKRRLYAGQSEDSQDWTVGHPIMFPNMLLTGNSGQWQQRSVQIRVPVDDENTMHYWFSVYVPPQGAKIPQHLLDRVPVYEPTIRYPDGRWNLDVTDGQDIMVWVDQGKIADRTKETLGASDKGITFYRRMLLREMERAEQGHDPLGTIRDPKAVHVPLPVEQGKQIHADGFRTVTARNAVSFSPIYEELVSVFEQAMPDKMGAFKGLPETAAAE